MNEKRALRMAACGLLLALAGCGGGSSSTQPNPAPGPWDFPSSGKFAVSLYADAATHAVGDSFDVKLVAYNLTDVFGASFRLNDPHALLGFGRVVYNPNSFPDPTTRLLLPLQFAGDSSSVSAGFSFVRGSHRSLNGSAVVLRFRCRARAAGTASLKLDPTVLAIQDSTGSPIPNFTNLEVDSLLVTVHP